MNSQLTAYSRLAKFTDESENNNVCESSEPEPLRERILGNTKSGQNCRPPAEATGSKVNAPLFACGGIALDRGLGFAPCDRRR